jgi:hypothetical protein
VAIMSVNFGQIRFGDAVEAIGRDGARFTGVVNCYFGAVGGKKRLGVIRDGGDPARPEIEVVAPGDILAVRRRRAAAAMAAALLFASLALTPVARAGQPWQATCECLDGPFPDTLVCRPTDRAAASAGDAEAAPPGAPPLSHPAGGFGGARNRILRDLTRQWFDQSMTGWR